MNEAKNEPRTFRPRLGYALGDPDDEHTIWTKLENIKRSQFDLAYAALVVDGDEEHAEEFADFAASWSSWMDEVTTIGEAFEQQKASLGIDPRMSS